MKLNYSLDDLRYFCIIAALGSFKKASESLDIPLSTLSRRIRKLEDDLQLRLLDRNAHRVTLTHVGSEYYERYRLLFVEANHIELALSQEKNKAKGVIRITAPIYLGKQILGAIFCDFLLATQFSIVEFLTLNATSIPCSSISTRLFEKRKSN